MRKAEAAAWLSSALLAAPVSVLSAAPRTSSQAGHPEPKAKGAPALPAEDGPLGSRPWTGSIAPATGKQGGRIRPFQYGQGEQSSLRSLGRDRSCHEDSVMNSSRLAGLDPVATLSHWVPVKGCQVQGPSYPGALGAWPPGVFYRFPSRSLSCPSFLAPFPLT